MAGDESASAFTPSLAGIGLATVTAQLGGKNASVQFQVIPATVQIADPGTTTLAFGATRFLAAQAYNRSGGPVGVLTTASCVWESSSAAIAISPVAGNPTHESVRGAAAGTADIKVTISGVASNTVELTVQ